MTLRLITGKPLKIIDLNSFPEIQDARFFEGTETQNVIYYATSTKIYSINLAIANPLVTRDRYGARRRGNHFHDGMERISGKSGLHQSQSERGCRR